ncbi:hypothetical protein Tco_1390667, partial [Tanacetum coccineum]
MCVWLFVINCKYTDLLYLNSRLSDQAIIHGGFWIDSNRKRGEEYVCCDEIPSGKSCGFVQFAERVIVVPLIDGMLGSVIPTCTLFGAFMFIIGVRMLECSGSPPY